MLRDQKLRQKCNSEGWRLRIQEHSIISGNVGLHPGVFLVWVIYGDGQCWTVQRSIPGVGYRYWERQCWTVPMSFPGAVCIWGETVLYCTRGSISGVGYIWG